MSAIIRKELTRARLSSLYSDFSHLKIHNPEGFSANLSEWKAILMGYFESNSDMLCFDGKALERDLEDPLFGRPKSLGLVLEQMTKEGTIQVREKFGNSESLMMDLLARSFSMLGVFEFKASDKSGVKDLKFVVVQNVIKASRKLKKLDNIYTEEHLLHLLKKEPEFDKMENLEVCLAYLGASVKNDTVRLDGREITESDIAVAGLQYGVCRLNESNEQMENEIDSLQERVQQLLREQNVSSARTLLKRKIFLEKALDKQVGSTANLTELFYQIKSAQANVDVVNLLEKNSMVLKKLNEEVGGAERVEEVLDKIKEESTKSDEVGEALGSGFDDDVEEELEEMERREKMKAAQKNAASETNEKSTHDQASEIFPEIPQQPPQPEKSSQLHEAENMQTAETG